MKIKVVELFAGVGGFRVGLNNIKSFNKNTGRANENGDWDFVWANQWEPSTRAQHAYNCYVTRFGTENTSNEDINKVNKKDIPDHDLLVGGFPCQDYSVARTLSNEKGIQGKKGVLWWDIAEVLKEKQPNFVLLENVDRLLKSPANQRGRDFAVMLNTFDDLGYIVQWRMINAGEYGMPQRRRRVFILASRKDHNYSKEVLANENMEDYIINDGFFNDIFSISTEGYKIENKDLTIYKDSVHITEKYNQGKFSNSGIFYNGKVCNFDFKELPEKVYPLGKIIKEASKHNDEDLSSYIIEGETLEKWEYLKGSKRIPRVKPNGEEYFYSEGQMAFPDPLDLPGRTMLTSEATTNRSSHIVFDEQLNAHRTITEVEAEMLQMFPPNWTNTGMTKRQRYFMMGNALVTGILSEIENKLKEIISL